MESNPRAGRKSRKLGSRRRHQMREGFDEDALPAADTEQWPSHATEELQDFFRECGAEHKGFITREDLGKAKFSFLGSPEELQLIFDWMDPERKGSLTSKEFTSGLKSIFSSQTRIPGPRKKKTRTWIFSKEEPTSFQPLEEADPEERRWFLSFMEQLGADHLFLDQAEIWQLWKKLRQEEPHLVGNLEGFLAKVTSRLQEIQAEKEALQMTLRKCDDDHHHEEMEQQIHSEKQQLQAASDTQGLAHSSMMHQALEAKEREMQYLTEGQKELEAQISLLRSERCEASVENQRLQETQRDLTGQLEQAQGHLQVTRGHLHPARGQVSWQVEEATSDPPVGPKNTSDSQHLLSFPEENSLPSLFEEGEWSQLLTNFTSPLPGNTTQVSWSPPPTPTSLQGHHTPRVVRQISITKPKSWQINQESPSDPEVPPRSPLGPSAAPTVVSELKVTGEPRHEETFQWNFQRVPSGERGEGPALGDSLPSQGLARSGKGVGDTDGDEVGQGNGPISNIFSKGYSSEESLQTPGPSADVQANTWEVGPKEIPHPGLHPAGSEQEVGSWGNEIFTAGPDMPIKTPELVLIQDSIPAREREQEKMNTDEWKVETSQQIDASGQETGLRESTGPDVGEVLGMVCRSTELPESNVGEVPAEGSKSAESPEPDVGEISGVGSRSTELPEPDVGEVPAEGSRSAESPEPDVGEIPGVGCRSTELPEPDVGEIPGVGSRSTELPESDVGEVSHEESKHSESPEPDVGEVSHEESKHSESPEPDVENAPSQEAGLTESPGPDIGNPHAQETDHVESPRPYVNGFLSQEDQILKSLELDVGKAPDQETQFIHLAMVMQLPEAVMGNVSEKESELIMSSRADADSAIGQEVGVLELARLDVGNVLCEEVGLRELAELERDNHPSQEIRLLQSPGPDVDIYPSCENRLLGSYQPGVGDVTELHQLIMRNTSNQEAVFMTSPEADALSQEARLTGSPGPDGDDIPGQETRFMESWEIDITDASGKEAQVLYSPDPAVGETPRQENVLMNSPGPDVADATGQEAWTGIGDTVVQEARVTELCRGDVGNASAQGSGFIVELHVDDTPGQENGFIQSGKTDMEDTSGQEGKILYLPSTDSGDAPGQGTGHIESVESYISDVAIQESGLMNSSVIDLAYSPGQEDKFMELPETDVGTSAIQESKHIDTESGLDVGDTPDLETGLSESARPDVGHAFLYSTYPNVEDALSQEVRFIRPLRKDVADATVQGPGVTELFKVDVGDTSDQDTGILRSAKVDVTSGETGLIESPGSEMGDSPGQEARFKESCEIDVGDKEIADIIYSLDPDRSDSPDQEAGDVELHGLDVSEIPIQEVRVLTSSETYVSDGPGWKVVISESYKAEIRNVSVQDTEIMHSSWPGVRDATDQEAEILHSPGTDVGDSPGQEAGLKGSYMLDMGGIPVQEGRFMELPEAGVDDGSKHQVEQTGSLESDVRDTLCQESMFRESCEINEEDALGLMEAPGPGLGETPGQEGTFLVSREEGVDDGSIQVTGQTGSPESDMKDDPGQEAGFREFYEKDMRDTLDKEAAFLYSLGGDASDQGILMLDTHEAYVSDASRSDQITRLIESYEPKLGDIPSQETEAIHPPGSERCDGFGQEAKLMELCETVEGDAEIAEIMYSPVPDMSDSPDQEAGVIELQGLYVSATPIQEARVLESPEIDVDADPGQKVVISESYEAGVGNASTQDAEILHSPRLGVSNSAGLEAESMHSPGPYMGDSPGQEGRVTGLHRPDVGNASDHEPRFMPSTETGVNDAASQEDGLRESLEVVGGDIPGQEAEILHSPGLDVGDSPGQETELKELSMIDWGRAPVQEGRFMELLEAGMDDGSKHQVGQTGSLESDMRDTLCQEGMFRESCEIDEEDALGLMEAPGPGLGETPGQEGTFLVSHEESVDDGSSQVTGQTGSPESDMKDDPGQEDGFRESYETDVEDALSKEVGFGLDGGDSVTGQGIVMLETHEPDVSDASRPDQITRLIESYGSEMGVIPSQEAETMHLPGSVKCDAFGQEAKFMEGDAEIMYSLVPDMSDSSDQEAGVVEFHGLYVSETPIQESRVLVSPETDVGDVPGQEVVISESYEADVGNASAQDAEILHSPRPGVNDSADLEAWRMHSPGPYVGDSPGQEGEVTGLHRPDVGNASDQEARFMPSSEADVSDSPGQEARAMAPPETGVSYGPGQEVVISESYEADVENASAQDAEIIQSPRPGVSDAAGQEAEILHYPSPELEDFPGQETGLRKSLVLNLGGAPGLECRFLDDGSCQQSGQIGSPGPDVKDPPGQETEILYSPSRDVSDYSHQGTYRLIDSSRSVVGVLSEEEIQFPESSEPSLGDAPEEKPGNIESPRPDVLPVIPERGRLQNQNPEDVWRAEDRGLQRQAQEGSLFPKDSSGNTLGPQDSEQALSILVEAGVQSGPEVLGGQITPLSSKPREENRSGVTKETKAEAAGANSEERSPDPDYLFHVLFLGDSNVGKTSFLHLLHHDSFATGLTATVGMDYRIKNLVVDNRWFALQLWDTAGQERYHSITKQFLRKADGIVLMYDVTCPRSFTHVRYWLDCIQEAGPDDVVILLLGNKIDCEEERKVSTEAGQLLAKEIGVIFGECSAVLGHNILEPIVTLARALQEQDTKLKQGVVELEKKEAKKKDGCCS